MSLYKTFRSFLKHKHAQQSNRGAMPIFYKSRVLEKVINLIIKEGARCSSVVRAFAHGAMGRRIDPSWGEPIELFLVPASAPRLVLQRA